VTISCSDIGAAKVASATAIDEDQSPLLKIILKKKKFVGKFGILAQEYKGYFSGWCRLEYAFPLWIR